MNSIKIKSLNHLTNYTKMMKNFIFILLVGYAAGRVMSDDNFSGPDFALSGE